jgi:hypothetical protein
MTKEKLFENVKLVNTILRANVDGFDSGKTQWTEDKDVQRLKKIYSKPLEKWEMDANNMANKITVTAKAVRRAKAAVECIPNSVPIEDAEKIVKIFLRRAVMLHVGEINPRDHVKLRIAGAII